VLSAIYRRDGAFVHFVAHDQFSPESVAAVRAAYPVPITSSNLIAVAVRERRVVHIPDVLVSGRYTELQRTFGYHGILIAPVMRDDVAIGAIAVMQKRSAHPRTASVCPRRRRENQSVCSAVRSGRGIGIESEPILILPDEVTARPLRHASILNHGDESYVVPS
jgi:hypothetical protein